MSKQPIIPMSDTSLNGNAPKSSRRWPIYLGVGAAVLVGLAYFDGGEEPIHPISQQIAGPSGAGE